MAHVFPESNFYLPHVGLLLIAFLLGMRHGLDLDHLAMIDSITRRLPEQVQLSRCVGLLFSLGHGVIVILFCVLINFFVKNFSLPSLLGHLMVWLSIVFLIVFGSVNIYSLLRGNAGSKKSILLEKRNLKRMRMFTIENPFLIMLIGGIFAVSFDTVSQVALFSLNVVRFPGSLFPVLLGFVFMIGMMITDGVNGLIVALLIRKASKLSQTISRVFTFSIGLFSTTIGVYEMVRLL